MASWVSVGRLLPCLIMSIHRHGRFYAALLRRNVVLLGAWVGYPRRRKTGIARLLLLLLLLMVVSMGHAHKRGHELAPIGIDINLVNALLSDRDALVSKGIRVRVDLHSASRVLR